MTLGGSDVGAAKRCCHISWETQISISESLSYLSLRMSKNFDIIVAICYCYQIIRGILSGTIALSRKYDYTLGYVALAKTVQ